MVLFVMPLKAVLTFETVDEIVIKERPFKSETSCEQYFPVAQYFSKRNLRSFDSHLRTESCCSCRGKLNEGDSTFERIVDMVELKTASKFLFLVCTGIGFP